MLPGTASQDGGEEVHLQRSHTRTGPAGAITNAVMARSWMSWSLIFPVLALYRREPRLRFIVARK